MTTDNHEFNEFVEERNWIRDVDLSKWRSPYSVTLTHKSSLRLLNDKGTFFKKLTVDDAKQNLRHFLNILNKRIFGKGFSRFNKRLKVVAVLEGGKDKHLHYHLLLESPSSTKLPRHMFELLLDSLWTKTNWGDQQKHIERSHDVDGFVNYVTKYEDKNTGVMKDSFDIENSYF
jgi:hypothetical protein|tara:strand:+ start:1680 stop:2201 length:522 start_codon:yes stop_codon:yes gene_type:complete